MFSYESETATGFEPKTRFQSAQSLNSIMQARDSEPRPNPMADFMGSLQSLPHLTRCTMHNNFTFQIKSLEANAWCHHVRVCVCLAVIRSERTKVCLVFQETCNS
jgi:hypothetical protein